MNTAVAKTSVSRASGGRGSDVTGSALAGLSMDSVGAAGARLFSPVAEEVAAVVSNGSQEEDEDDDEEEDDDEGEGWIQWFCSLEGHACFAEIDEEYIRDTFNLFGIKAICTNFDAAIDMILGAAPEEEDVMEESFVDLYRDAMDVYGLIHSRFIISPRGLTQMREKCAEEVFGHCPRVLCDMQPLLPLGNSTDLRLYRLRMFCPLCQEIYELTQANDVMKDIDGAYFGPSFPHIFLQTFPSWAPMAVPTPYQPRLFGFRIHNRKSIIEIKLQNGEYGSEYATKGRRVITTGQKEREEIGNKEKTQAAA